MSKEINYGDLVYYFKGSTTPKDFGEYRAPMYIYDHMKNGKKTLQQIGKGQDNLKKIVK